MSLYIGGAQCKWADIGEKWEEFDELESKLAELAAQFDVFISRDSVQDGDVIAFVILNKPKNHQCFYGGEAFDYDMSVEVSDTFDARANEFIAALNKVDEFIDFHNLEWSQPKVLYFVVS